MSTIHGASWKGMSHFRNKPAALAVYWIYCARTNKDNVAWPSLRGLSKNTGWSVNSCASARKWLVEHGALERVTDYTKPTWRNLDPTELQQRKNLDKTEYYRPTGTITIDGKTYPLLYIPQDEDGAGIDDQETHVSSSATSDENEHAQDATELDSIEELDSINTANAVGATAPATTPTSQDEQPEMDERTRIRGELFKHLLSAMYGIEYEPGMKLPKDVRGHVNGIVATLQDESIAPSVTVEDTEAVAARQKRNGLDIPKNGASWLRSIHEWRSKPINQDTPAPTPMRPEVAEAVFDVDNYRPARYVFGPNYVEKAAS